MAVKGVVTLKNQRYGRWTRIFRAWYDSDFIAVVIHCDSYKQMKAIHKSATMWRTRNNNLFWIHAVDGETLYLVKSEAIKNVAMEVVSDDEGVVYFYDTSETV